MRDILEDASHAVMEVKKNQEIVHLSRKRKHHCPKMFQMFDVSHCGGVRMVLCIMVIFGFLQDMQSINLHRETFGFGTANCLDIVPSV